MEINIDATVVDAWTEFISLREQGSLEDLDEQTRSIIYVVAAAEMRGEKINQRGILRILKPQSAMPILSRINELIADGWLVKDVDEADRRIKNIHLTPKSIALVNLLSATLRKVVKPVSAIAAGLMTLLMDYDKFAAILLTTEFLSI